MVNFVDQTIDLEAKAREELQVIENMGFVVPSESQSEEEIKKLEEEKKAKKAEWLKKTKKKAKTDEEESQDAEEIKNRIINGLKHDLINNRLLQAEKDVNVQKVKWLMEHHEIMNEEKYDELNRLESILDIDISGKDLVLRLDLDVPLSAYIAPPPQAAEQHGGDPHQRS